MIQHNRPAAGRPLAQADASCDSKVNKLIAAKVRWQVRQESCDSSPVASKAARSADPCFVSSHVQRSVPAQAF